MARLRGPILALLLVLASCTAGHGGPRLVLLITVDTLRADRLGSYGSTRELTPNLDALAARSRVFTSVYAPASHTLPSVVSLLTGRFPEELGVWSNLSVLPAATPTIGSAFRKAGWHTSAVVSSWVLRRAAGLSADFDHYDDRLPQLEATRPMPERVGTDTTDAALAALDACLPDAEARCFLWVHYQDPHGPYTPPGDRRQQQLPREQAEPDGARELPLLGDSFGLGGIPEYQLLDDRRDAAFYRAGYDGEVAYLDAEVGRLLAGLAARGLTDRAAIVFTADHGESLGEDDYWFAHGELLSDVLVRIPFLVHVPGEPAARRDDLACLVDLLPTLSQRFLAGGADSAGPGRPLLAPGAEDGASEPYLATLGGGDTRHYGLVDPRFKYVATQRGGVWDGRLTRRGHDDVDLTAPAPQVASAMRDRLIALMDRYRLTNHESRAEGLDAEDRAKLEALGYVDRGADE